MLLFFPLTLVEKIACRPQNTKLAKVDLLCEKNGVGKLNRFTAFCRSDTFVFKKKRKKKDILFVVMFFFSRDFFPAFGNRRPNDVMSGKGKKSLWSRVRLHFLLERAALAAGSSICLLELARRLLLFQKDY